MSTRRLDAVMRIRALQEKLAGGDVAVAQGALGRANAAEHAAWHEIATVTGLRGQVPSEDLLAQRSLLTSGVGHARHLGRHREAAATEVDAKVDAWQERKQALDGIERLDGRLRAEARATDQRRELAALDDLVVMRWRRRGAA